MIIKFIKKGAFFYTQNYIYNINVIFFKKGAFFYEITVNFYKMTAKKFVAYISVTINLSKIIIMKKVTVLTLTLSLVVLSCRQNDDILSTEDINTLKVIQSKNKNSVNINYEKITLTSEQKDLFASPVNDEVLLPPKK